MHYARLFHLGYPFGGMITRRGGEAECAKAVLGAGNTERHRCAGLSYVNF